MKTFVINKAIKYVVYGSYEASVVDGATACVADEAMSLQINLEYKNIVCCISFLI